MDTEILYLLIVGCYDIESNTNFLEKLNFQKEDHENLSRFLNSLNKISSFHITPHIFIKFAHLIWEKVSEEKHYKGIMDLFMSNFSYIDEKYIPKDKILELEHFRKKFFDLCNTSLILTTEIHSHNSVITSDEKFARIREERGNILVVYYPDIKINIISLPQN